MPVDADIWKQREVAAAFLGERSLLIPDRQKQLEIVLRVLRFTPREPRHIVDLGTGDGIVLATALEAWPQASGVALDFSPLMLEEARRRLAKFGDRAQTVEADLQSPDWIKRVQGSFDAVLSSLAIHHLTDDRKKALYAEIYRLIAEGGVFLNVEHVSSPTAFVEEISNDAMTEHLYERRRDKGEQVTAEQVRRDFLERPDRAANILAPVEEQCQWLRQIGFKDVDCFWKYFELAIFGGFR
jgi:ubiquinone/menaquinone biosynthesis C-methylase UbiE